MLIFFFGRKKQKIVFRGIRTEGYDRAFRESRRISRIKLNLCIFAGNPIFRREYYKQLLPPPISFVSFLIRNTVMCAIVMRIKANYPWPPTKARDLLLILYYEMQAEIQLSPFPLSSFVSFISFQSIQNPAFASPFFYLFAAIKFLLLRCLVSRMLLICARNL